MTLSRKILLIAAVLFAAAVAVASASDWWVMRWRTDLGAERVAIRLDAMPDDARVELWDGGDVVAITPDRLRLAVMEWRAQK